MGVGHKNRISNSTFFRVGKIRRVFNQPVLFWVQIPRFVSSGSERWRGETLKGWEREHRLSTAPLNSEAPPSGQWKRFWCKARNILRLRLRYSVVTQLPRQTRFHLWVSDGCGCCKAIIIKKDGGLNSVDGCICIEKLFVWQFFA